jgi:hypothetical protein
LGFRPSAEKFGGRPKIAHKILQIANERIH